MTLVVAAALTVIVNRSVTSVLNDHVQLARQLAAQNTPPAELVDRLETRSVRARLVLADGQSFGSLTPRALESDTARRRTIRLANATGPLRGAQLTLQVDFRLITAARSRLTRVLLFVALAAVVLIAVGVPFVVRRALSPLDAMTRLARDVARGGRGRRLWPNPADTELGRTAAAFDEMLDSLEGAERRALASEESMRRFVADAAHELRTPIAGVTAAAEAVLQQPVDADPRAREELLRLLGRDAQRAGRLIEDLLDLARIDSGLKLQLQQTDLREVVDGQVERARLLHPDLSFHVDGHALTTADPARIGQVVANLLNNACQVSPPGETVRVAVTQGAGRVSVSVCDAGPGVADGDRDRIFERLVRLDGQSRSAGAGLGLPIARGIACAHGGDVVCQPATKGAVFTLWLPQPPPTPPNVKSR
ncbi:MAG: HAMP domain-containing histidine kinase [Mycobacteriaceae bacterium]|nr:HAMP domain-containing histidine kinase [Mycobacteriaceae bacterium]